LAAVAAQAVAAETRIAAEEGLVAARDAQATAVAKLATVEALGEQPGAQATAEAELAAAQAQAEQALVAQATAEAVQLTAVAERNAVQTRSFTLAQPTATPVPPTPTSTSTPVPTATQTPVPTATPVPRDLFVIEYLECQTHRFGLGSVKGQVFDREGKIIQGAQVEVWLNGIPWESSANPATTNEDGWYEWILSLDQTVRFYALYVRGRQVDIDPIDFEVPTISGCFQQVNFRQQ
jgi:hypothetical protein